MSVERRILSVVCLALVGSCAGAAIGGAVSTAFELSAMPIGLAGIVAGATIACVVWRARLASRMPDELDGWFSRRRKLRVLWLAAAVLAVVNTARVCIFIAAPSEQWASVFPVVPESATHQCLAAYVRAGELSSQNKPDLWRIDDYAQDQPTTIVGMGPFMGDPYEYPPAFAVAPRAAVAATNDYLLVRALWFGASSVGFWLAYLALAIWAGRRAGATALLLVPAVALSFPLLLGLQWGQAHVLVLAGSIAGMVCFARGKPIAGGALLAATIATKLFPALLLVHLAVRKEWRAIAFTLVWLAAFSVLSLVVLGPETLSSFARDQVPSMLSGDAFSYTFDNPDNHSLFGLAHKLAVLGVPAGHGLARALSAGWAVVALTLTVIGARRASEPAHDALQWLAILALATLQSPFAPTYTALGSLWVLAILTGLRPGGRALVVIAWIFLQGSPPIGSDAANVIASLPSQAISIAIALVAAWPRRGSITPGERVL